MTTPIIGLFVLLVIALIGWAIAETKNKVIKFFAQFYIALLVNRNTKSQLST